MLVKTLMSTDYHLAISAIFSDYQQVRSKNNNGVDNALCSRRKRCIQNINLLFGNLFYTERERGQR